MCRLAGSIASDTCALGSAREVATKRAVLAVISVGLVAMAGSPTAAGEIDPSSPRTIDAVGESVTKLAESKGALGAYFDRETEQFVIVVAQADRQLITKADTDVFPAQVVVETRDIDQVTIDAIEARLEGMRHEVSDFAYAFGV